MKLALDHVNGVDGSPQSVASSSSVCDGPDGGDVGSSHVVLLAVTLNKGFVACKVGTVRLTDVSVRCEDDDVVCLPVADSVPPDGGDLALEDTRNTVRCVKLLDTVQRSVVELWRNVRLGLQSDPDMLHWS